MSENKQYLLKTVNKDGVAYGGFRWPLEVDQLVEAPDFDPAPYCGGGLHGALDGVGNGYYFKFGDDAIWIAAEIPADAVVVDLDDKVKVNKCITRCIGSRAKVTAWLAERCHGKAIIGATVTVGYRMAAIAGDSGAATAGNLGAAIVGCDGTATVGYHGISLARTKGVAIAGNYGVAAADGQQVKATAGNCGVAITSHWGAATVGHHGTAIAGDRSVAVAGRRGTAIAGHLGKSSAGKDGTIIIKYFDEGKGIYRLVVGYVGENGIKPDTLYKLDAKHNFVEAQ